MQATSYLLITMLTMHLITLINIVVFDGGWNGIVMAVNTVLLVFAFGLVLPLKGKKTIND